MNRNTTETSKRCKPLDLSQSQKKLGKIPVTALRLPPDVVPFPGFKTEFRLKMSKSRSETLTYRMVADVGNEERNGMHPGRKTYRATKDTQAESNTDGNECIEALTTNSLEDSEMRKNEKEKVSENVSDIQKSSQSKLDSNIHTRADSMDVILSQDSNLDSNMPLSCSETTQNTFNHDTRDSSFSRRVRISESIAGPTSPSTHPIPLLKSILKRNTTSQEIAQKSAKLTTNGYCEAYQQTKTLHVDPSLFKHFGRK